MSIPGIWFPKIFDATKRQKRIKHIDKLDSLNTEKFHEKYSSKCFPFILRSQFVTLSIEKAIDLLLNEFGSYNLKVRYGDMSNPDNYINRRTAEMPLREFIKNYFLDSGKSELAYAGSSEINTLFLEKLNIKFPAFYPDFFFNEPRMWMGRAGTTTQLHKDIPDNFAFNYFGKKKWIIYPPKDFPYLYMVNPNEKDYPDFGASLVNIKMPDYTKYPKFIKARKLEFILESGEMFYLPAGWSHYVENIEDTLMINYWLLREKSPAILGMDK